MKVFYRISDKGNPKEKLPNAGKFDCLKNAIKEFGVTSIHVIADNCTEATISFLKGEGLEYEETSLGNSTSFLYMIESIIQNEAADEDVYLLEDDYIHLAGSKGLLEEGLKIADYVTLYDHPDKYLVDSVGGNPLNYGRLHTTRIYVTNHSHWRETDSTTMTFACKVRVLSEDIAIWKKYLNKRNPDDFHGFMELTQNDFSDMLSFLFRRKKKEFKILLKNILTCKKSRILISAVPASATHAEIRWLAPVIDWNHDRNN